MFPCITMSPWAPSSPLTSLESRGRPVRNSRHRVRLRAQLRDKPSALPLLLPPGGLAPAHSAHSWAAPQALHGALRFSSNRFVTPGSFQTKRNGYLQCLDQNRKYHPPNYPEVSAQLHTRSCTRGREAASAGGSTPGSRGRGSVGPPGPQGPAVCASQRPPDTDGAGRGPDVTPQPQEPVGLQ